MAWVIASSTRQRVGTARLGDDAPRPGIDLALRIRHLPLRQSRDVRNLVLGVGEGEEVGAGVQTVLRQRLTVGMVRQVKRRDNFQLAGPQRVGPVEEADRVVERVMLPVDGSRLRIDPQFGLVHVQVMAVVRPDHQPVARQADGAR